MASLPQFYPDNITVHAASTVNVRGNSVSDCYGSNVVGIYVENTPVVRMKDNKSVRMRSMAGNSCGVRLKNVQDAVVVYTVASRCTQGFDFDQVTSLNAYNITAHNCEEHVVSNSSGVFRNVALSTAYGDKNYQKSIGFTLTPGVSIDLDYTYLHNVASVHSGGSVTSGTEVKSIELLYLDEPNDELTPDYISTAVNTGTSNPIGTESPSIGGVQSTVTDEVTAAPGYEYELIDNSFWDVENPKSVEMSFINMTRSRILANAENSAKQAQRDYYMKTASSMLAFSELYPIVSRYCSQKKFKNRIMDMVYAGQNPGTVLSYASAIGGYTLYPSFFQRLEDTSDCWIIAESDVNINNYLLGGDDQNFGIGIDVLGVSTLSESVTGECYRNTMQTVADLAPVRWILHEEVQPSGYVMFADRYNDFEDCVLSNMIYDEDFTIVPEEIGMDSYLLTPLIPTSRLDLTRVVSTESGSVSGAVELSLLDRIYSESITRLVYYRQGTGLTNMSAWTRVIHPIGEVLGLTSPYVQFKVSITGALRRIDYAFISLCMRNYYAVRDWTRTAT